MAEKYPKSSITAVSNSNDQRKFIEAKCVERGLENVKVIPDGRGYFTRAMGMMVQKDPEGFGVRSWRYAMVVIIKEFEAMFVEPGYQENCPTDPFGVSSAESVLGYLSK